MVDTTIDLFCGIGPRYADVFGAETSVARRRVVIFANGFSVIGVHLDTRTTDGDYEKFTVWPDEGTNVSCVETTTSRCTPTESGRRAERRHRRGARQP